MINFVTIRGRKFDIVEQFDDYLIVQDLATKIVYTVKVCFLDFSAEIVDTPEEKSNVFSMEWFKLKNAIKKDKEKNGKEQK
jgi:hypothetical protein